MQQDQAATLAKRILELRRRRMDHLPAALFGEYAWGLLLVLFTADACNEAVSIDEVCQRAGGSPSVTYRWWVYLEQIGLVARAQTCPTGNITTLTPSGIYAVEAYMHDVQDFINGR